MADAGFVAGDWGTSHLRLVLCDADGVALDSRTGPGAAELGGGVAGRRHAALRYSETFESLTADWVRSRGTLPAVLCGMVGSSIGWLEAPYVPCPANPLQIVEACVTLRQDQVHIVPGLSCRNRFAAPDFLRGEETQILGALRLVDGLRQECRVLCHPGTHTKWVVLQDGVVREFFSAPTGELFALLCEHSVLVRKPAAAPAAMDAQTFRQGLEHFNEFPQAQLLHRLFECRSRQLSGDLAAHTADAYLSGLLIGSDVHGALQLLSTGIRSGPVYVIGSSELTQLYVMALAARGQEALRLDGAQASLAGLAHVHQQLSQRVAA
jgi:2-dehydro-3-deoxygalactonokinase